MINEIITISTIEVIAWGSAVGITAFGLGFLTEKNRKKPKSDDKWPDVKGEAEKLSRIQGYNQRKSEEAFRWIYLYAMIDRAILHRKGKYGKVSDLEDMQKVVKKNLDACGCQPGEVIFTGSPTGRKNADNVGTIALDTGRTMADMQREFLASRKLATKVDLKA